MLDNVKRLFASRKAIVALSGIIAAVANELFGRPVNQEIVLTSLGLVGLVVFGIAWEDSAEKANSNNVKE